MEPPIVITQISRIPRNMKAKVVQEHRMTLQRQHRLKGHLDEFKSRVVRAQRGIGRLKSFVDTADFGGIAHLPEQMENDPWLHHVKIKRLESECPR